MIPVDRISGPAIASQGILEPIVVLTAVKSIAGAVTDRKFPSSPRYLKKSLDRSTTGPSAWTGRSKNLRDARSSIASRSRRN
jgi:hypothetical protein